MTIALGMLTTKGFVVAADSQITQEDFLKRGRTKILVGTDSINAANGTVVVAGAGDTDYSDAIRTDILDLFLEEETALLADIEDKIRTRLKVFYQDHVLPFLPHENPEISLIIGAQRGEAWELWATSRNSLRRCCEFDAIGIGRQYAFTLFERYRARNLETYAARLMAGYIIEQVKQTVDGCGKDTHIVSVDGRSVRGSDPEEMAAMQDIFEQMALLEAESVHYVLNCLDDTDQRGADISGHLARLRDDAKDIVERY